MKLLKPLFVLLLIVSIAACSSDDSNPNVDTDGDGVIDSEDLCPDVQGTLVDQGCYLITNINLSGEHNVSFLETIRVETYDLNGIPVTVTITDSGSILEIVLKFFEDGTYSLIGEYVNTETSVVVGNDRIIVLSNENLNETGTFVTNNDNSTISLTNSLSGVTKIYNVSLFNQNELNLNMEESGDLDPNGTFESIQEIELIR